MNKKYKANAFYFALLDNVNVTKVRQLGNVIKIYVRALRLTSRECHVTECIVNHRKVLFHLEIMVICDSEIKLQTILRQLSIFIQSDGPQMKTFVAMKCLQSIV